MDIANASRPSPVGLRPSLVVQTVVDGKIDFGFDRWFSATLEALSSASDVCGLVSWKIVVGVVSVTKQEIDKYAHFSSEAQRAGGELLVKSIGLSGYGNAHNQLLDVGDENCVLVIDPDVIVLSSTLIRLIFAMENSSADRVSARAVPVDDDLTGTSGCILYSRRELVRSGGFGPLGSGDAGIAELLCPEAVIVRDRRSLGERFAKLDLSGGDSSLLEIALDFPALSAAQKALILALSVDVEPMVSVVMRTQVRRPEALRDALICLAAQTDGRFEVLLVVHDADRDAASEIVDDQPEWLRCRTKIIVARGGTRSVPLNVGISAAVGSHIAFLDDDDLVFAHWIQSFLGAAELNPRRLLRALTAVQRIRATTWVNDLGGHEVESELFEPYPSTYDLADHLRVNMTPFMAFAFPKKFFEVFGGADESLHVCEDWDLSLRAALILGVGDIPSVTSIYRRWSTGGDSYSVHDEAVWQRDMRTVRGKLDALPVILPPGRMQILARHTAITGSETQLAAIYASTSWRITAPIRATGDLISSVRNRIATALHRPKS